MPPADGGGGSINQPFIVLTETNFKILGWGLLGAVVLLQEVPMQALERAEGGGIPCGGVLEVVVWQPYPLSRACKGAQEGNKPGVGRVGGSVTGDGVVGDTEAALFVRLRT